MRIKLCQRKAKSIYCIFFCKWVYFEHCALFINYHLKVFYFLENVSIDIKWRWLRNKQALVTEKHSWLIFTYSSCIIAVGHEPYYELCYRITEVEPKYYADGENAYEMKRDLSDLFKKVFVMYLILNKWWFVNARPK